MSDTTTAEQTPLEALTDLVGSEAYAQIAAAVEAAAPAFVTDARFFAHVRGLASIMPRLSEAVAAANASAAAEAAALAAAEASASLTMTGGDGGATGDDAPDAGSQGDAPAAGDGAAAPGASGSETISA